MRDSVCVPNHFKGPYTFEVVVNSHTVVRNNIEIAISSASYNNGTILQNWGTAPPPGRDHGGVLML